MTFEDRHATPTPEGISIDFVLAGLGSRFAAFSLDFVLQVIFIVSVIILVTNTLGKGGETSALVAAGLVSALALIDFIGYFIICEMLWSGRSVGKGAAGIRVVRTNGTSVGFWSSLLRNVMRFIDMLPGVFYLVGSVLILATSKNQRLGDLLGNTVVIRERRAAVSMQHGRPFDDPAQWMAPAGAFGWAPGAPMLPPELAHWDVTAVNDQELVLVSRFLQNRWGYTPVARHQLALQLADRLWPLVAGPVVAPPPEQFLEAVLLVKSARG
jgi:uncharacterized RDD family membrane protein YckC